MIHDSFINFTHSFVDIGALHTNDNVMQLASCTFDAHVLEILASLICGATVIMLQPGGNMNFIYLSHILRDKQVTHLRAVPTFLSHLCNFVKQTRFNPWMSIRNVCCVGEQIQRK